MLRYLKLYGHFVQFSFSKGLQFRLDFFFRIFMDLFYYLFNIIFYKVLYLHTPKLGGLTEEQALVFIGSYITVDALFMTFFANNFWLMPQLVNKGELDYYLIRPVSSFFFITSRELAANSSINLMMAISILVYSIVSYSEPISGLRLLGYSFLLLNGLGIYVMLRILFILPVFWTQSNRGLDEIFWNLVVCNERPDRIFSGMGRFLVTVVLPFSLMASFPVRTLFEENPFPIGLHAFAVSGGMALILSLIWKKAIKDYTSASS